MTILPTSRAIRFRVLELQDENKFLPQLITMSEFLQRAIVVDGFSKVDAESRIQLLLEASDFDGFALLNIERNFFTFMQNSNYIFKFFEELSGELVEIESLNLADTYAQYSEHIDILIELYNRYNTLLDEKKVIDPIFIPKKYKLNNEYISSLEKINLELDGYLTNFELKILKECSSLVKVKIHFSTSKYNTKLVEKLKVEESEFKLNYEYEIDLEKKILINEKKLNINENIEVVSFSERVLQIAFIKQKVYQFIKDGIEPKDIAIVVPDESITAFLREFDTENNFNFAMGISLRESFVYQQLRAFCDVEENSTVQNRDRAKRYMSENYELLKKSYLKVIDEIAFKELIESFINDEPSNEVQGILKQELFRFKHIFIILNSATTKSLIHLFLNRVAMRACDDVRGGEISVIGLLETRSIKYKAIVIVDFNEDIVPRKSDKDMFLNSDIRYKASLPTLDDRANLQKHYYYLLFSRSDRVAISFVESSQKRASRFISQLSLIYTKVEDESEYSNILLTASEQKKYLSEEIESEYDFSSRPLSASALKIYLTCKRKYYYKYIKKLHDHEMLKDIPDEWQVGNTLHLALQNVYTKKESFSSVEDLRYEVLKELEAQSANNPLERFQVHLWAKRLTPFFANEIERFSSGAKVLHCEKSLKCKFQEMDLFGNIDRIDIKNDTLEILDYKSGNFTLYSEKKVEDATDFQLEFYYLLASTLAKVNSVSFYDLRSGRVINEEFFELKLERLQKHLNELSQTKIFKWSKCEDLNSCSFCEFTYLCQRAF
ncbi:MAG: PD-(D/E)XK nuclease family protein [Helicobacteraceae bacterium]|nr:PD-(D/E)XK nuclease family protein [Helicobacteraceae bacterium]